MSSRSTVMIGGLSTCMAMGRLIRDRIWRLPAMSSCGIGVSIIASCSYCSSDFSSGTALAAFTRWPLKSRSSLNCGGITRSTACRQACRSCHGLVLSLADMYPCATAISHCRAQSSGPMSQVHQEIGHPLRTLGPSRSQIGTFSFFATASNRAVCTPAPSSSRHNRAAASSPTMRSAMSSGTRAWVAFGMVSPQPTTPLSSVSLHT